MKDKLGSLLNPAVSPSLKKLVIVGCFVQYEKDDKETLKKLKDERPEVEILG